MPNLYTILSNRFLEKPDHVALDTGAQTWTFSDLHALTGKMASWLASLELPKGSRLAVQVEKSPEALALYLATLRAGMIYVPLNTAYRLAEMEYFLQNASPAVFVCDPVNQQTYQAAVQASGVSCVETLSEQGAGSLMDVVGNFSPQFVDVEMQADDLAAILYTSGTTGRSKGAMLSHQNLISNAQTLHEYWRWQQDDVLLHMLPIFHIHGLFVACHGALYAGARMIWLSRLDVEAALRWLPESTVMMGVPTYYVRLLSDARFTPKVIPKMRLFVSGSAPLLLETFELFEQKTGHVILERYGMSETGMLTSNPYDPMQGARLGTTVGTPLPGVRVRVVDDSGQPCDVGQVGHIQVLGPNVFSGYWQMPDKTREEFTDDGWFKTGDMGRWGGTTLDGKTIPDAYLSIVGRSKDLIISGGYNVYPKEVELVIDTMPGVEESAVIGVPHPDFGEMVIAVVVPQSGKFDRTGSGTVLDESQMISDLKNRLANYKVPKRICQVAELPRNAMGKVQKNILRDRFSVNA